MAVSSLVGIRGVWRYTAAGGCLKIDLIGSSTLLQWSVRR